MVGLIPITWFALRKKWFCSIIAGRKVEFYICNIGGLELCFNTTVVKV